MATVRVAYDVDDAEVVARHDPEHTFPPGDPYWRDAADVRPVTEALRQRGHDSVALPLGRGAMTTLQRLAADPPDIVFNLCDTLAGEGHHAVAVPAMLDLLGIPYVGADASGVALTKRKHDVKAVLTREGLPTARYQILEGRDALADLRLALEPPVILKPTAEHASIGIALESICWDTDAVRARAAVLFERFAQPILVEEFIDGRELYVSIVGDPPRALPLMEHTFDADVPAYMRIRTFDTKWFNEPLLSTDPEALRRRDEWNRPIPHRRATCAWDGVLEDIEKICLRAFRAAGCRDWGRVDVRIDRGGIPLIIDITPNTYLAPSAPCARAAGVAGLAYEDFVDAILSGALARRRGLEPEA